MSKNIAIRNFISFAILAAIMIALCFVNVLVPATTSRFVGFVPAITKGIDINGGYASNYEITYNPSSVDCQQDLNQAIKLLSGKLNAWGYTSAKLTVGTNDNLYVEVPKTRQAEAVLSTIATAGEVFITTDAKESIDKTKAITGADINDAYAQFAQSSPTTFAWGVNIDLTQTGKNKLAEMTKSAGEGQTTLNIFVGDQTISQIGISGQVSQLWFFGQNSTQDTSNITALAILMGKLNADFDMVGNQVIEIAPTVSAGIQTATIIALALVCVLILALFFLWFGELGFLVTLNLTFLLTLTAFLMQAIPTFVLCFSGIVGIAVGLVIFFVSNYLIFAQAKKGYAEGKKIPLVLKLGLKSNIMKIVDISVVAILACVAMLFVGNAYMQSFAFAVIICSALNLLTSLVFNLLFVRWYGRINKKQPNKIRFTREENISDLD